MVNLVGVQGDPDGALVRQQLVKETQPRPHHGAPLVVAETVLDSDRVGVKPLAYHRSVYVVVVAPAFVADVVGWVNEDAVHLAGVERKESLEGVEIVPVDDQVAIERWLADSLLGIHDQGPERDRQVVVVDEFLALEAQFTH